MKIIELLNKIANNEEVPKKIKVSCFEFEWRAGGRYYENTTKGNYQTLLQDWLNNANKLNSEVEILEEEKKTKPLTKKDIEALGYACGEIRKCFINGWTKSLETKPLEEQKKIPKKINMISSMSIFDKKNIEEYLRTLFSQQKEQVSKLNEVIDYLYYLKSKGE